MSTQYENKTRYSLFYDDIRKRTEDPPILYIYKTYADCHLLTIIRYLCISYQFSNHLFQLLRYTKIYENIKPCFILILGEPLPEVLWYLDNDVIDDSYQQTFEGTVKNGLTIRKLKRKHTIGKLRCLASNNNITRPVESSVTLKMLCKFYYPIQVEILSTLIIWLNMNIYYSFLIGNYSSPTRCQNSRATATLHCWENVFCIMQSLGL